MSSPVGTYEGFPFVNDRFVLSFKANSALSAGTVVKLVAGQTVDVASASTDLVIGVVWNNVPPQAGFAASVITRGVVRVKASGAITAGNLLVAGPSGTFADYGASTLITPASGSPIPFIRAIALESATSGSYFLAMLL